MKLAVVRETRPGERRVAMVPELLAKLSAAGWSVAVETGAGLAAGHSDRDYYAAGAVVDAPEGVFRDADVVASVNPIERQSVAMLRDGALVVSFLPVSAELDLIRFLAERRVSSLAVELIPRISRAQAMDALSSQALVAGYRAALVAAERLPRFFPLLMTAAGTVPPAHVLVLGAGVAGLQAIATARRLGAVVSAYDVRAAAAEEVRSLGARFVELNLPSLEGAGGYAREMTQERTTLQRELLAPHVAGSDVLITTAAVPGRTAPLLVTRAMVEGMRRGSVVVDIAAEAGGNVEGVVAGEVLDVNGVSVIGAANVASDLATHASRLYSANIVAILLLITKEGSVELDLTDAIVDAACVTHDGVVRHESTRLLMAQGSA